MVIVSNLEADLLTLKGTQLAVTIIWRGTQGRSWGCYSGSSAAFLKEVRQPGSSSPKSGSF